MSHRPSVACARRLTIYLAGHDAEKEATLQLEQCRRRSIDFNLDLAGLQGASCEPF